MSAKMGEVRIWGDICDRHPAFQAPRRIRTVEMGEACFVRYLANKHFRRNPIPGVWLALMARRASVIPFMRGRLGRHVPTFKRRHYSPTHVELCFRDLASLHPDLIIRSVTPPLLCDTHHSLTPMRPLPVNDGLYVCYIPDNVDSEKRSITYYYSILRTTRRGCLHWEDLELKSNREL